MPHHTQSSATSELPPLGYKMRPVWEASARRYGYDTVEAAIVGIYQETGSILKTAERMNFSRTTIWQKLIDLGIPRNSRGGANNRRGRRKKSTTA